jgi:hypothetical protein
MSGSSARIESEAHHFLEEARHRHNFSEEFDAMPVAEQLAITRAMRRQEPLDEKAHPELSKVSIETFPSGNLKEVDVKRAWYDPRSSALPVYKREHDPTPPPSAEGAVRSVLHGFGEALRLKRTLERKVEEQLLKQ